MHNFGLRLSGSEEPGVGQAIGFVTSVRGSEVGISLPPRVSGENPKATVGRFVGICSGSSYVIGTITALTARQSDMSGYSDAATASLDLLGEITQDGGERHFTRGVTGYPAIGDTVQLADRSDIELVYCGSDHDKIEVGKLHQDPSIRATIRVNDMLNKHFAVLGTTGVGKSSGVVVLLRGILEARPDVRIFLLDGHNEYGRCFGDRAHVINPRTFRLPFWLFNFEEFVDVVYGGRPPVVEEVEILSELIPVAKSSYGQYKTSERATVRRSDPRTTGYTVDTPVPYLLQDLLALLDERMGRLDNRSSRMSYHRLITRIETMRNDPRYAFMFQNANVGGDTMAELLVQLFRLDPDGKPICVMQLAGLPAEVTDAVVCVLSRLAFDFGLWSEGQVPLLFVCEEAHRFASADPAIGFHPTRRALSRIAKEGRKYGVFLGLVTQRPAELDPTIISQCSTLFAMRMANERDQALLRSAVSDGAVNLLPFVPSLGTQEVIGFGEGVALPVRMTFDALPPDQLPHSEAFSSDRERATASDRDFVKSVVDRWRGATLGTRQKVEEPEPEVGIGAAMVAPRAASPSADPARYRLLKRPNEDLVAAATAAQNQTRIQR